MPLWIWISWVSFDLLENLSSNSLSQNTHILIDFGTKETEEIHIQSGTNVLYRGFFPTGNHSKIRFILEEGAKLDARFLVFASKGHAKFDLETIIQGSRATAEIIYRAFAFEDAEIQANTHLDIRAWLEEISGNIEWKNIFFADQAKISGTPRISAASDKISAGHSLSFEKISELDEFFLQSRGIPPRKARRMLAEAHIHRIFSDFPPGFEEVAQYLENAAASGLE